MKKILPVTIMLLTAWFMMVGVTCQERNVQVPVLNSASTPIHVTSTEPLFAEHGMYDAAGDVEQIRRDEGFLNIVTVNLQGVEYKIVSNSSTPGTRISGFVQVSASAAGPYKNLVELTDLDPQAEVGIVRTAELLAEGVTEINSILSIFSDGELTAGTEKIYYRLRGTATSPGAINTDFTLELTIYLSVLGVVEVSVPAGP